MTSAPSMDPSGLAAAIDASLKQRPVSDIIRAYLSAARSAPEAGKAVEACLDVVEQHRHAYERERDELIGKANAGLYVNFIAVCDSITKGIKDTVPAALASVPAPSGAEREVAWLIERRFPADGLQGPEHRWYAENRLGFHWWTPDAAGMAKRFTTRAEAEAYPAYQMIASDPTISITEHVFLGAIR